MGRKCPIVKANDRYVCRHRDPELAQPQNRTCGELVIPTDDRVGCFGLPHHIQRELEPGVLIPVGSRSRQCRIKSDTSLAQRVAISTQAQPCGLVAWRPIDERDPSASTGAANRASSGCSSIARWSSMGTSSSHTRYPARRSLEQRRERARGQLSGRPFYAEPSRQVGWRRRRDRAARGRRRNDVACERDR
jgi:hypothetical protein